MLLKSNLDDEFETAAELYKDELDAEFVWKGDPKLRAALSVEEIQGLKEFWPVENWVADMSGHMRKLVKRVESQTGVEDKGVDPGASLLESRFTSKVAARGFADGGLLVVELLAGELLVVALEERMSEN